MSIRRQKELAIYRFFDWLSAAISWLLFFIYRSRIIQPDASVETIVSDEKLALGLLVIPLGWIILYSFFDKYSDIYRYSRLSTIIRTVLLSFFGSLFLFFTVLVDDQTIVYTSYLRPFGALFLFHFILTSLFRMIILTWAKFRVKSGKVVFNTLLIGDGEKTYKLVKQLQHPQKVLGFNFVGFVNLFSSNDCDNKLKINDLGGFSKLDQILESEDIEEVFIALGPEEQSKLKKVLDKLYEYRETVLVKVVPELYSVLLGKVKMQHVLGTGLIEIDQHLMPNYEQFAKRALDLSVAVVAILFCAPLFVFLSYKVKRSSTGPILYRQERIGKNGRPFDILKFRSMYVDAEEAGPQLSSDHDPRITPFGRVMRKWRLDETPQFFNLLRGDMSLVGPRPERQFFIDQILEREGLYKHLLTVRPGITSLGLVRFGYASNVDEMLQRLQYDLIYLENMSFLEDIKILCFTVMTLVKGKGK